MKTKSETAAHQIVEPLAGKPIVLVVDDEHMVRIMVRFGLERNGFDVWSASNGQEAIRLYQMHSKDISVVLIDVQMPTLDGPRTLEILRGFDSEVLVCFMNSDKSDYELDDLLKRGAAYVIAKPFHLDELAQLLQLLLGSKKGVGRADGSSSVQR